MIHNGIVKTLSYATMGNRRKEAPKYIMYMEWLQRLSFSAGLNAQQE
nr:MAG TPA: hypothetical protein [Caudoviricetes sp.]